MYAGGPYLSRTVGNSWEGVSLFRTTEFFVFESRSSFHFYLKNRRAPDIPPSARHVAGPVCADHTK